MNNPQVFMKGTDLFTDSKIIAKALGLKHVEVLRRIDKLFIDFPDLRVVQNHPKKSKSKEVFIAEPRVYRGNETEPFPLFQSE